MLSTNEPILLFYKNIVNSPQLLADGYRLISNFLLQKQQNRRDTLLNLMSPQVPILSLVMNVYPLEIMANPTIEQSEKDSTMQFLLNLVTDQLLLPVQTFNDKKVSQIMQMIHKIHNSEGFQRWIQYYMVCLSRLQSSAQKIGYFLVNVLKNADDRVSALSQQILKIIVKYEFSKIEQKLQILYYILKSLAYKVQTDPEVMDAHVNPYLNIILQLAFNHINQTPDTIRFSLKILTVLLGQYEIQCSNELARLVQNTALSLITSYINLLNSSLTYERGQLDFEQQDQQPIEIGLYQIMQLCMVLFTHDAKLNLQIIVYLGVISTYLSQSQYKKYVQFPDQYLMDVDDEGTMNVRNKSVFFLLELLEHRTLGSKSIAFLKQYTTQILTNLKSVEKPMSAFLKKHKLPLNTLKIDQIYRESMLFILHSFTQQLMRGNTDRIFVTLGAQIKNSPSNSIEAILQVVILNSCLKKSTQYHSHYASFLREMVNHYSNNVGMLIVIARGLYQYSPNEMIIVNSLQGGVPYLLVANLCNYLLREDSAQMESAYLVLQFFIHLLQKCQNNKPILQQVISFNNEIVLLKKFLQTGMTEQLVCDLTCKLANTMTLQALYKEIQNGYLKDQALSKIISTCLKNRSIFLTQEQIIYLCQVYSSRIGLISEIVGAFIEQFEIKNSDLAVFLNKNCNKQWIPGLIKQKKLLEIQKLFVESVNSLTNIIESLEMFQNQLLVPYYFIASQANTAIEFLNAHSLLVPFFQKLYRYAKLFQGTHLKIITCHIFIALAQKLSQLTPKVIELVRSYGKIESSQWEDENDFNQFGISEKATESIISRLIDRIVNEKVEKVFEKIFGDLCWDSKKLYDRLALLQSKI